MARGRRRGPARSDALPVAPGAAGDRRRRPALYRSRRACVRADPAGRVGSTAGPRLGAAPLPTRARRPSANQPGAHVRAAAAAPWLLWPRADGDDDQGTR